MTDFDPEKFYFHDNAEMAATQLMCEGPDGKCSWEVYISDSDWDSPRITNTLGSVYHAAAKHWEDSHE